MPTALDTLLLSTVIALVIHLLSRLHWSLGLLVVPVAVLWNWGLAQEIEGSFGTSILNELGWRWVAWQHTAANLPLVVVGVQSHRLRGSQIRAARARKGNCSKCGCSRRGLASPDAVCPECGARAEAKAGNASRPTQREIS